MGHGPYVPVGRLLKILDEYEDLFGLSDSEIAREIAANTGDTEDAWIRRLFAWRHGESDTCRFNMADKVLSSLYLIDRWYTDLSDIYEAA